MQKILKNLLIICFFTLSLGQFSAISRGEAGGIYIFDIFVAVFAVVGSIYFLHIKKLKITITHFLLFSFVGIAAISLFKEITTLGVQELLYSGFYLFRVFFYALASVVVFNMIKNGLITQKQFLTVIFISASFISIAGFIQLALFPDFSTLDTALGWDPHKNRLVSTFFDPNFVGGYLSVCLGIAIGSLLYKKYAFDSIKSVFFILIPLLALFLTFSRSSWGMFAVIILVLGVFKARWMVILALFAAFLTYYTVPRVQTRISGITDPADSAAFRLVSWKNTLDIAKDNLVLGVGFNTFRYAQKGYGYFDAGTLGGHSGGGSDSSLLLVLATTGIIGIVMFLSVFYSSIFINRDWRLVWIAILAGLVLHSQFVNSLFFPAIMFLWMTVASFMISFRK